jgi:hypothetical protein
VLPPILLLPAANPAAVLLKECAADMAGRTGLRLSIARHEGEPGPRLDFQGLLEIAYRGPKDFQADYAGTWGDAYRLTCSGGRASFDDLQGGAPQTGEAGAHPLADSQGISGSRFAAVLAGPEAASRLMPAGSDTDVLETSAMRRRISIRTDQSELMLDMARTPKGWLLEAAWETSTFRFGGSVQRQSVEERLISLSPLD